MELNSIEDLDELLNFKLMSIEITTNEFFDIMDRVYIKNVSKLDQEISNLANNKNRILKEYSSSKNFSKFHFHLVAEMFLKYNNYIKSLLNL
jgi:hypothetical protein